MGLGEILIIVFTAVVAVCTGLYSAFTGWLAWETRRMRQQQSEPRVSVQAEVDQDGHPGYELVIRNVGQGPARDVKFSFTGDPSYLRNSFIGKAPPKVDELPAIRNGIDFMEAGFTLRFTLGTVTEEEFRRAAQEPWTINVQYNSIIGKPMRNTYVVDFSQFEGTLFRRNWSKETSKSLDQVSKEMNRWGTGFRKIHVIAHQGYGQDFLAQISEDKEIASPPKPQGDTKEFVEDRAALGNDSGSESE